MGQHASGCSDGRQSPWWHVWAPLLARAAAIGLALLGLAGIGLAAAGSESSPELVRAPFTVGLARLLGGGIGAMSAAPASVAALELAPRALDAGTEPLREPPAPRAALPPAPLAAAPPATSAAAPPAPLPCVPSPPPAASGPASGKQRQLAAGKTDGMAASALTADGRVVLNRAGLTELQRLPGIGAKRAQAILELRQRLGRFRRTSDLLRIKGIGPRLLERISPQLVLDE